MEEFNGSKAHVLLLPFPSQGHINPIFQFGTRLVSKGLKTTLATTVYIAKSMHVKSHKIAVETISDGFDETGINGAKSSQDYVTRFIEVGSRTLTQLIKRYKNTSSPITCLVHDAIFPWALDVAKELGLIGATFFTQSCSVNTIFYQVKIGALTVPVKEEPVDSIPGLPPLALRDLPTPLHTSDPVALDLLIGQFTNPNKADWLLCSTFDQLESEVLKLMAARWQVRTIGPTVPSMYLEKHVEGDTDNNLNLFKPSECTYLKWLNTKETGSVIYISFGSMAAFDERQMEELQWGIKQSDKYFLWVVRETEQSKLHSNFCEDMLGKGLVVTWCSQIEVLAHDAIGCFLTHCGWNSTIEALSLGVPMVAMPHIWDQPTNAKFVEDFWELGIRVKANTEGLVKREELELCIREVMEGERGKAIKKNSNKWSELAKNAVDAGGSSDLNIEEFVASLSCT